MDGIVVALGAGLFCEILMFLCSDVQPSYPLG